MPTLEIQARARLRASAHLSFFAKSEAIYAYHDLWGYCLAMDRVPYEMLQAFGAGARVADVAERFAARLPQAQIDAFVDGFARHHMLVPVRRDERAHAFAKGHPVLGPWVVRWQRGTEAVLAYRDRALARVVLEPLGPIGAKMLALLDGEQTLAELAEHVADALPQTSREEVAREVRRLALALTHSDRQVLRLVEQPMSNYLAFPPPHTRSSMPYPRLDAVEAAAARGEARAGERASDVVDLARYHREVITDADDQFDVGETTLSHMFRDPHPALGGRSYAQALCDGLEARGYLPAARADGRARVVEIGGGVGWFGQRFRAALAARAGGGEAGGAGAAPAYAILDLAPALQRSQRAKDAAGARAIRFLTADASRPLPLASGSIDLLIANEMIADLEMVRLQKPEALKAGRGQVLASKVRPGSEAARKRAALALLARARLVLDDAPEEFWLNLGALHLVEEIARVLRPGGAAVLTEFGAPDGYPIESTHLDHAEFSIAFGQLAHVARAAGLEASLAQVPTLIGLDGRVRVLSATRTWFEPARALCAARGVRLEKLAYTEDALRALCGERLPLSELREVRFAPATERALGLRPKEFWALLLRRP